MSTIIHFRPEDIKHWSTTKATGWYDQHPWLVGSNFMPASAINQLEMWQAETFNPEEIERELAMAASIGMNTMRVFLHDLLWSDPGFVDRINTFLDIAARHGIKPMLVLFDSCWDPNPQPGPQRAPTPGVHNPGWVQCPGMAALQDPAHHIRLEEYVRGVVGAFGHDERILAWDVWNEPDNLNTLSYADPESKLDYVLALLPKVFMWAHDATPVQPLTSGLWQGDWSSLETLSPIQRVQLEMSDVVSFHNYDSPEQFEQRIRSLQQYGRPILCTEYMARVNNNTFQTIMPIAKKHRVALFNWGFVAGKTQTFIPWDSWQNKYAAEPELWFHDIFCTDGTCYRLEEVEFIRQMTGAPVVVMARK